MNLAKLGDGRGPANSSQAPFVPVMKGFSLPGMIRRNVSDSLTNKLSDKSSFQNRHRRNPWQQVAGLILERGKIADDENLRMTRNTQVGLDKDASRAIHRRAQFLAQRRSRHSSGPQNDRRFHACVAHGNSAGLNLRDHGIGEHFHAEMLQLFQRAAGKILRIRWQYPRPAFDEMYVCKPGIDRAEIMGESVPANLG